MAYDAFSVYLWFIAVLFMWRICILYRRPVWCVYIYIMQILCDIFTYISTRSFTAMCYQFGTSLHGSVHQWRLYIVHCDILFIHSATWFKVVFFTSFRRSWISVCQSYIVYYTLSSAGMQCWYLLWTILFKLSVHYNALFLCCGLCWCCVCWVISYHLFIKVRVFVWT